MVAYAQRSRAPDDDRGRSGDDDIVREDSGCDGSADDDRDD